MSNPHTFSRPVFLFSYLLAGALSTVSPVTASDGAISYTGGSMIFLGPDLRRQPDAYAIELSEPILRSPVVVSFYSVLGAKVFEHTLALETPTHPIVLGALSENLAGLPSGTYFYDVQTSGAALQTQQSDSLQFQDISDNNLPDERTAASFSQFGRCERGRLCGLGSQPRFCSRPAAGSHQRWRRPVCR